MSSGPSLLPLLAPTTSDDGTAHESESHHTKNSLARPTEPRIATRRDAASMALTAALTAGDHKHAIGILWEHHRDELFRYCRRMLKSEAEAADVTQKVFESAIMDLRSLRSVDSARTWLVGIARHRCLDHARSTRRDLRLVDTDDLAEIAAASQIADSAEDPRAMTLLGECLDCLNACDRELIELRYYRGLPFKEIAKRLGRTPAALRVRLTRARRLLRQSMTTRIVASRHRVFLQSGLAL